jgi:hypothetical protein
MKKVLFIHLPRTGGTFIRNYGKVTKCINYYANPKQRNGHQPARDTNEPDKWFQFGLIRNPFDWYVSQYFYFSGDKRGTLEEGIFEGVDKGLGGESFKLAFPNLEDWIRYGRNSDLPYFWLSDVYDYMFCDDKGKLLLDYVGKFEKMYDEVEHVLEINEIKPPFSLRGYLGERNASERGHYRQYLTKEAIDIIMAKDKKIFDLYDYDY